MSQGTIVSSNPDAGRRTPDKLFAAYVEFAKILFGNLFIINAGSAIALITFLGNVKAESTSATLISLSGARSAIICYGVGAFFAVLSAALAAWTENSNANLLERYGRYSASHGVFAVLFIMLSSLFFLFGCVAAVDRLPSTLLRLFQSIGTFIVSM